MRILLYGDIHLGTSGGVRSYERPNLDDLDVDVVVSVGDVIDNNADHADSEATGQKYEQQGRRFFEYLDSQEDTPVVAVPGNHDPAAVTERLVDSLDSVVSLHEASIEAAAFDSIRDDDGIEFIGWGSEQFDQNAISPGIEFGLVDGVEDWKTLDHNSVVEIADRMESQVGRYLADQQDVATTRQNLEIPANRQESFVNQLRTLEQHFESLTALFSSDASHPIVLTHVSPFNTACDHCHSADDEYDRVPTGSLALRMALVAASPFATISGHTHIQGQDVIDTGNGHAHVYNPGEKGVIILEVDPERDLLVPEPVDL